MNVFSCAFLVDPAHGSRVRLECPEILDSRSGYCRPAPPDSQSATHRKGQQVPCVRRINKFIQTSPVNRLESGQSIGSAVYSTWIILPAPNQPATDCPTELWPLYRMPLSSLPATQSPQRNRPIESSSAPPNRFQSNTGPDVRLASEKELASFAVLRRF